jgi:hypothetical protein
MKLKHYFILGTFLLTLALLRETGVLVFERFSNSGVRYSLVKSSRTELPGPHTKVVIRDDAHPREGTDKRDPGVLYVYFDGFVFEQSIGRKLPLYKTGESESYLRFEFVLDKKTYAGGIVSIRSEDRTIGLRTLRDIRKKEFRNLVDTALRFHGFTNLDAAAFETKI